MDYGGKIGRNFSSNCSHFAAKDQMQVEHDLIYFKKNFGEKFNDNFGIECTWPMNGAVRNAAPTPAPGTLSGNPLLKWRLDCALLQTILGHFSGPILRALFAAF